MRSYLRRHIDMEGEEHGPAFLELLDNSIKGNPEKLDKVIYYDRQAIYERINFWNGLNFF